MNMLEVKHVIKILGKKEVVRGVSFEVERGQLLALLGPSGCGKTTTLRMIAGLEVPDYGEIWIDGTLASGSQKVVMSQKERHIGMVFQDLALWPHMTVYKNIDFGLKAIGLTRAERQKRIEAVLCKVNMKKYANEYPSRLSGGQQQLIAIARAIVTEPKLLLMDEPLSNIDVQLRDDIRKEIKRIQQETGITTVYVTHDQEDAFLLANKIAIMNTGVIEQVDSPEGIYFSPKTFFVANFVGESNILPVRILRRDRVSAPWGEFVCNTKDHERGDAFLFFRPHQALIEENGYYEGIITSRDFIIGKYRYHISISGSGCEITLYDQGVHEIGKPVRFSMKEMRILFA
ncbi:MAG: ABC transporter ATP-binding protein [Candidatus Jettenia sp.]|nr:MAG: ABC transporter ATP-binding protein [Candidatus Jettenia sp.]